jgi:hypothetical protein
MLNLAVADVASFVEAAAGRVVSITQSLYAVAREGAYDFRNSENDTPKIVRRRKLTAAGGGSHGGSHKGRVQFRLNFGCGGDFKNLSRFFYRGLKTRNVAES